MNRVAKLAVSIGLSLLLFGCASRPVGDVPMLQAVAPGVVAIADQGQAIASGFFVAPNLLMTNEHLLKREPLYLVNAAGEYVPLKTVSVEKSLDVALLKVELVHTPVVLSLRQDSPAVGERVFAIGNPFGTGITTTTGIVSAQPRAIGKANLLQTDAAINPGNSGGPLVDEHGQVVGIVTSRGAVGSGIGFAVPSQALIPLLRKALGP